MTFLLVCMCGGLGAVARFVLNTSIQRWWNRLFPLSTFIINVVATFCAGLAAATFAHQVVPESMKWCRWRVTGISPWPRSMCWAPSWCW